MRVFLTPCPESRSLIGRKGSREQIDDVPYANEPHPQKDNSPLSFSPSDWLLPSLAILTTKQTKWIEMRQSQVKMCFHRGPLR